MKVIGSKLREIGMMVTLLSMVHMVSCEDRLDRPRPSVSEGEQVEVSLCVGIADEVDAASLAGWFPRRLRKRLRYRTIHCPRQSPISSMVWRFGNTMEMAIA